MNKLEKIEIFVSYSHKDLDHKESLESHLSLLRRNKVISTWSDHQIIPGQQWGSEITDNLKRAQIILFLVSSDFIASDYCVDVEMTHAIERHSAGEAIVIPILVRPCDWKDSVLGELQALPSNAEPVTRWNNLDDAWLDIVEGLKRCIHQITNKIIHEPASINWESNLNLEFKNWLQESEVELSHRHMDSIKLSDIFVYQDLRVLDHDIDELPVRISSADKSILTGCNLIFGEEQTGKTSLVKTLFVKSLKSNSAPLLIRGADIKSSDINKAITTALHTQYLDCSIEAYQEQVRKSLLVDDFSHTKLNHKHQIIFIQEAKKLFENIVIFADESFQYIAPDIPPLEGFSRYELMRFGNLKRYELTKKWVELGVEEQIDESQLYLNIDTLKQHADTLVKNNTVPSKPIYLLTILQTFESYSPLRVELTSYGHCYQYLIYRALEKSNIRQQEVDTYINFLTEFAGQLFLSKKKYLTEEELTEFIRYHNSKYILLQRDKIIEKLLLSNILYNSNKGIRFKYRYIYYFYAAKYLSDHLEGPESSKNKIRDLITNLHQEDSANIIIFITHHTKDAWIMDEIQISMMELFDDLKEASLTSIDLAFMRDFIEGIPKLVIEQREIEKEREKDNIAKDKAEDMASEIDSAASHLEPSDLLAKINRSFKALEIVGQILRNRHGSLDRATLISLLEESYCVGLRFLQFFLALSDSAKDEILENIKHLLIENPNITNDKLEREAKNLFLLLTYGVIFGVLRKIAFSVGTKELEEIYKMIGEKYDTPAVMLINQSVELQFMKRLDIKKIKQIYSRLEGNPACIRVLKEVVIQYIYMHHVSYKEKQQISHAIGLPILNQLTLERQASLKA